jgi:hypothetical protein
MIPFRVAVVAAIASALFLLVIFELIRSRRLQERYALLWLVTGSVILLLSVWRDALRLVAEQVGIAYPPSALFVIGFLFILAVLLHYSTVISELSERNVRLAQDIALVEERLRIHERGVERAERTQAEGA